MSYGHTTTVNMLTQAVSTEKLHHALLFWGPSGTGKFTIGLELTRLLFCKQPGANGPCNTCRNCKRLSFPFVFHPDVRLLREFSTPLFFFGKHLVEDYIKENPRSVDSDIDHLLSQFNESLSILLDEGYCLRRRCCNYAAPKVDVVSLNRDKPVTVSLAEKYQSKPFMYWFYHKLANYQESVCYSRSIKIDTIRKMQKMLYLHASEGKYKTVIIDDADNMLIPAQNCLLKLLEEPPDDSLIILVVKNPKMLLPTIRSRCQTVPFGRLSNDEFAEGLQQEFGFSFKDADMMATFAQGNFATALSTDIELESSIQLVYQQLFDAGNLSGTSWILKLSDHVFSKDQNSAGLSGLYRWLHSKVCSSPDADTLRGSLPKNRPFTVQAALMILDGITDLQKQNVYNLDIKLQFETMLAKTLKELSLFQ